MTRVQNNNKMEVTLSFFLLYPTACAKGSPKLKSWHEVWTEGVLEETLYFWLQEVGREFLVLRTGTMKIPPFLLSFLHFFVPQKIGENTIQSIL